MKKIQVSILLAVMLATTMAAAQPDPSALKEVPGRLMITVSSGVKMTLDKSDGTPRVGVAALDALAEKHSVFRMEQLYAGMTNNLAKVDQEILDRVWLIEFAPSKSLSSVKADYSSLTEVEETHLDHYLYADEAYLPNDPGIATNQWYLRNMNIGQGDVRAVGAWNQALGDTNIVIAILDSGVDWHHPDLGGSHPDKVNGAIWTNWAEYYGTDGVDDDSNGKIDDVRGYDFVNASSSQVYPGEDYGPPDNDPMDHGGHGTHVAGCAAAMTNNGIGIAGTAAGCKIMPVRIMFTNTEGQGVGYQSYTSQGMIYAANNGANIVNLSLGPTTSYLTNAANACINAGILILESAGNDNVEEDAALYVPDYLHTRHGVLAVAATAQGDTKASFSNYGTWVEISAPGVAIYSTFFNHFTGESTYTSMQGTSMSCPIAAGSAALLWSANPGMNYLQISQLMMDSADDIDDINGVYAGKLGDGRINLLHALGDNENRYPEEFPTLFDAINSASDGYVVAVEGGLSIEAPVTILGRDVEVLGGYSSDYTSRDPINNPTILQGSLVNAVLKFYGDVENTTVVDGFVVQGGGGLGFSGIPYTGQYGGGVQLQNVSPTLRNIEVTGNSVGNSSTLGLGGGIMMNNSHAVLENVNVHGNTGIYGAGIFINNSSPTMIGCAIDNNTVITDNMSNQPLGGGIHLVNSTVTMTDCTVDGHTDCLEGGGIYASDASTLNMTGGSVSNNFAKDNGGGLYVSGGSLNMLRVAISDNSNLPASTFMNGGGMFVDAATVSLDSMTVFGNNSNAGGGAVFNACAEANVTNSVFSGNTGQFFGGAMYYNMSTSGLVSGNTIIENEATFSGGAGVHVMGNVPDMLNNIIAFNTGGTSFGNGVSVPSAPASFVCNDVFSNASSDYSGMADPTGTDGNISVDPEFCDMAEGNYNLGADSLCSAENSGSCGLIGALGDGCGGDLSPVPDPDNSIPVAFKVEQNFPNPFNPSTTIRFALPSAAHTQVVIFDLAGRKVKTLVDDLLTAQSHEAVWTGKDDAGRAVSAGVYFYRVSSGEHLSVGRMALIK
jgi:subtilisin family serine protease